MFTTHTPVYIIHRQTHTQTDTAWRHRPRLCIASRGNSFFRFRSYVRTWPSVFVIGLDISSPWPWDPSPWPWYPKVLALWPVSLALTPKSLLTSLIQAGGRPPYWKSFIGHNSAGQFVWFQWNFVRGSSLSQIAAMGQIDTSVPQNVFLIS